MPPPQLHAARAADRRSRARRPSSRAAFLALALLFPALLAGAGGGEQQTPQRTKARHLASFARFVTWPENAFADARAPFVAAVLGEDPLGEELDRSFEGRKVGGHPVVVRRYAKVDALGTCHLLFVPAGEAQRLAAVLERLEGASVLLVGESEGFARRGGILNFYEEESAIRFEINPARARERELQVSSKLLELARIVESDARTGAEGR